MAKNDPYQLGEELSSRLGDFERPLYMLAHHDDEIATAGLMQRLGPNVQAAWVTNSDGLYFESDLTPEKYGQVRKAEGIRSVGTIDIPESNTRCLDFSEVEIYRIMSRLHAGECRMDDVQPFFEGMRQAVRDTVFETRPDMVVTLAWQGGQPEHDLTHFFTWLAVREFEADTGRKVEFFHTPAYEYTILVALRFHPLYRGTRVRLRLTEGELRKKMQMIQAYPSQVRLFDDFRKVFRWIGRPAGFLTGGPGTMEDFLSIEEFGPVPTDLDYTAAPHLLDFFTYMFDDFEGVPVTFKRSVRPIVKSFL
ncbi:MAG: PIG-L family deacetylase [Deltaproteobacteria bacterium]|nr:PIG-L family deacetylase [Deltaproteobacteria bacterium]